MQPYIYPSSIKELPFCIHASWVRHGRKARALFTEMVDGRSSPPWYPAALMRADGARAPYGEHAVKPAHVRQGWVQGRGEGGEGATGFQGDVHRGAVWWPHARVRAWLVRPGRDAASRRPCLLI